VMSSDSAVTFTSVHSEARSWSIPSEDPYEEVAQKLLEQAPRHPEDLVPTEDEAPIEPYITEVASAPTPPLPPPSLLPTLIRPPHTRAAMAQRRATTPPIILSHTRPDAPSSRTPPLHLLSIDRRADIPEVTLSPQKRLGIAFGPRYEVGESSSAAASRPTGGLRADYSFVATMDREIMRDLERDVGYGITDTWDEMLVDMLGIYTRLDDEQSERQLMAGRLNMLYRDRGYVVTYSGGSTAASDYKATSSRPQETGGDYRDAGGRPHEIEAVHKGTEAAEETSKSNDRVQETAWTC
ncbi:hypothetical protein Tco_0690445, partial [Tanacetum coccineum]